MVRVVNGTLLVAVALGSILLCSCQAPVPIRLNESTAPQRQSSTSSARLLHGTAAPGAPIFEAPLPDDASVMESTPSLPAAFRSMSGKWSGKLIGAQFQVEHTLVVERLDPRLAWLLWSVGDQRSAMLGASGAWYRVPGIVSGKGITLYQNGVTFTYHREPDDTMSVIGERQGFSAKGTLKRIPTPTRPYQLEEPQMYWPAGIDHLQPGESESTVKTPFPSSAVVQRAPSGVSPEHSRWLGKWSGYACSGKSCEIKLAVLSVTDKDAQIIQLYSSEVSKPSMFVRTAYFVGDELLLDLGSLHQSWRMRPSGEVETVRLAQNGSLSWGLMTRTE